ncbi:MAG: single-stranded DNA-binding protein [Leucobacter sp.]
MSSHITVIGQVATHPQIIGPDGPSPMCTFRLASNERRYDREKSQWVDGPTNWFTINAFRSLGQHAKDSFQKGDRVIATGRVRVRDWKSQEKSGTSIEVDAEALGHDLRWGVSRFEKRVGARKEEAAEPEQGSQLGEPSSAGREQSIALEESSTSQSESAGSSLPAGGFANPGAGTGGFANVPSTTVPVSA